MRTENAFRNCPFHKLLGLAFSRALSPCMCFHGATQPEGWGVHNVTGLSLLKYFSSSLWYSLTKVCLCHSTGAFWSEACSCCTHIPQKCFAYTYGLWRREHHRFLPLKRNISHTIVQQPSFQCVWKIILTLPVVSRKKVENRQCHSRAWTNSLSSCRSYGRGCARCSLGMRPVPRSVMGFLPHCWDSAGKGSHLLPRLVLLESLMLTERWM